MADGSVPDMLVRRDDALHVKAIRAESREVDFIASTSTIDSYDEIVDVNSWKLEQFLTNPVVLYNHDRSALPIGYCTMCKVVGDELICTIKFATADGNPEAERVFQLVLQKVLRAVSVGFRPTDGKYEMRDGRDVYVLYGNLLREISVCPIGANPDCLAQMKSASLAELGVVTAAAGFEAETVRGSRTPEMRERIRSAIAIRDGITIKTTPELPAPSLTTTEGATGAAEHEHMDPKELQAKLDASEKALVDAKVAEKSAADKAAAAEARIKSIETERDAAISASATLTKEHEKACTDRDANLARATKAEGDLIALEVDQLVGKKIAATEKDDFVKLRTDSPALFTSMIAKRPDMKLTDPVIAKTDATANGAPPPALGADAGSEYFRSL